MSTMEKSKLLETIAIYSKIELRKLRQFIASPYFNENTTLICLYDFIIDNIKSKNNVLYNKQYVWKQLCGNKKYDDIAYRRLHSDLLQLCMRFMAIHRYQEFTIRIQNDLLASLNKRNLHRLIPNAVRNTQTAAKKYPYRDSEYFYNQFITESEVNYYLEKKHQRSNVNNLELAAESLDIFYLVHKLKYCCEILNYKNVIQVNYKLLLIDEILAHLKKSDYSHVPAINIYYNILLTLNDGDNEKHFKSLKQLLTKHADKFHKEEARIMYGYAQNYCIRMANKGKLEYLTELFNIFNIVLKENIIFEKGIISPWDYKNMVSVALRLKEYQWTDQFIHKYKSNLLPKYQQNAYSYNLAKYCFSIKDFDKVMHLLQGVAYDDVFYNLDSKSMLLKTYYELNEKDALESLTMSFRIFLRRNKLISEQHRINYLNLITFTKKLININSEEKFKIKQLKQKVNETKNVADINWLLEKINQKIPKKKTKI